MIREPAGARDENQVVRGLVEHIRREGLTTGDRLPSIRTFAGLLGLGPNAVRDGLLRAQTLGLVRIHPRSGAFVQSTDAVRAAGVLSETLDSALLGQEHNLFHLMEARRLIEVEAVGQAAARRQPEDLLPLRQALRFMEEGGGSRAEFIEADEAFHVGLARITGNQVFVSVLGALLVLLRPYRMSLLPTPEKRAETGRLHAEIYRAVLDGDLEGARHWMREHLSEHYETLLDQIHLGLPPAAGGQDCAAEGNADRH